MLDLLAARLIHRWKLKPGPQLSRALINCESGRLGCNLEEHAARFPKVDRTKILAVQYRRDPEAQPLELLSPRQLLLVRQGPESDMMDRPYPAATTPESLGPSKIHHGANTLGGGFEAQAVALFTHRPKAHRALEQPGRTLSPCSQMVAP